MPPGSYQSVAFHGSDNSFWLDAIDGFNRSSVTRAWTATDHALASRMADMVAAFARSGNPSIPGVTVPRYDTANEMLIAIDVDGSMAQQPFPGRANVALLHGLKIARQP